MYNSLYDAATALINSGVYEMIDLDQAAEVSEIMFRHGVTPAQAAATTHIEIDGYNLARDLAETNKGDPVALEAKAGALAVDKDQDWSNEATTYVFYDGSKLTMNSYNDVTVA